MAHGQVRWTLIQSKGTDPLALIGRAEQVDEVKAISSTYACQNCCGDFFQETYISPSSVQIQVGESATLHAFELHADCYGFIYPIEQTASWNSSNPSVASVSSGQVTSIGAGQTTITATWNSYTSMPTQCSPGGGFLPGPIGGCCGSASFFRSASAIVSGVGGCAVPVMFRQVGNATNSSGNMVINYVWGSSTGRVSDLSNVTIGERVDYPGVNCSNFKYCWPSPPWASSAVTDQPTIINVAGNLGGLNDTHESRAFRTPYRAASFTANQIYRYKTPCANGGNWVTIKGPLDIVRSISQKTDGRWKYTITKDGNTISIDPLP